MLLSIQKVGINVQLCSFKSGLVMPVSSGCGNAPSGCDNVPCPHLIASPCFFIVDPLHPLRLYCHWMSESTDDADPSALGGGKAANLLPGLMDVVDVAATLGLYDDPAASLGAVLDTTGLQDVVMSASLLQDAVMGASVLQDAVDTDTVLSLNALPPSSSLATPLPLPPQAADMISGSAPSSSATPAPPLQPPGTTETSAVVRETQSPAVGSVETGAGRSNSVTGCVEPDATIVQPEVSQTVSEVLTEDSRSGHQDNGGVISSVSPPPPSSEAAAPCVQSEGVGVVPVVTDTPLPSSVLAALRIATPKERGVVSAGLTDSLSTGAPQEEVAETLMETEVTVDELPASSEPSGPVKTSVEGVEPVSVTACQGSASPELTGIAMEHGEVMMTTCLDVSSAASLPVAPPIVCSVSSTAMAPPTSASTEPGPSTSALLSTPSIPTTPAVSTVSTSLQPSTSSTPSTQQPTPSVPSTQQPSTSSTPSMPSTQQLTTSSTPSTQQPSISSLPSMPSASQQPSTSSIPAISQQPSASSTPSTTPPTTSQPLPTLSLPTSGSDVIPKGLNLPLLQFLQVNFPGLQLESFQDIVQVNALLSHALQQQQQVQEQLKHTTQQLQLQQESRQQLKQATQTVGGGGVKREGGVPKASPVVSMVAGGVTKGRGSILSTALLSSPAIKSPTVRVGGGSLTVTPPSSMLTGTGTSVHLAPGQGRGKGLVVGAGSPIKLGGGSVSVGGGVVGKGNLINSLAAKLGKSPVKGQQGTPLPAKTLQSPAKGNPPQSTTTTNPASSVGGSTWSDGDLAGGGSARTPVFARILANMKQQQKLISSVTNKGVNPVARSSAGLGGAIPASFVQASIPQCPSPLQLTTTKMSSRTAAKLQGSANQTLIEHEDMDVDVVGEEACPIVEVPPHLRDHTYSHFNPEEGVRAVSGKPQNLRVFSSIPPSRVSYAPRVSMYVY